MACAEHRVRNHPRPPLLETTRVDGVKAPQHRGTPRSYHLVALLDLVAVLVLVVVIIQGVVLDGADVHGVVAVGHRLACGWRCERFPRQRAEPVLLVRLRPRRGSGVCTAAVAALLQPLLVYCVLRPSTELVTGAAL